MSDAKDVERKYAIEKMIDEKDRPVVMYE